MQQIDRPLTLGIMGGSAAGKTTWARKLAVELADLDPVILNQDSYFRDWSEFPPEERERRRTSNRPEGVRWEALIEHVERLMQRKAVQFPVPGTGAAARGRPTEWIGPGELIIVEGHLILWDERLRDLLDVKLFIDVDPHERVLRRLLREVGQDQGNIERSAAWYRRDVIPNFPIYTESCKRYADLIIPGMDENPVALQFLIDGIRGQICPVPDPLSNSRE